MNTYIALIRGLGGKYTLPMKDLVRLLEELGLNNTKTYIQSGNAVFQSEQADATLADRISKAIERDYDFAPEVILLTLDELKAAIAANPYPEAEVEPKSLHLTFLATEPENPNLEKLESLTTASESFVLIGKVFYFHAPEGVGRSKGFARKEKLLGVPGTARNWRSVCKVSDLAEQIGRG